MRPDGSETVRLMDDPGRTVIRPGRLMVRGSASCQRRSGEWESVVGAQGRLRSAANDDLRADISIAVWSPDGKQAVSSSSARPPTGLWVFDASTMATRQTAKFFKNPSAASRSVPNPGLRTASWLPDRCWTLGGLPQKVAIWEMASGTVRALDISLPSTWEEFFVTAGWLPDSRRFLAVSSNGLALVDSATGQSSPVAVRPGTKYELVNAGRTLMVERSYLTRTCG